MNSVSNNIKILILYLILSFINTVSVDFNYPSAISLSNGNIFIVEKKGIFVYNEQLINIIYNYTFENENEEINDVDSLSNVIIKYDGNYIICLINLKIYFFDNEGVKLLETDKIINDTNISYLTLTPINLNEANFYYYVIGYFLYEDSSYKLKLCSYKIDILQSKNIHINNILLDEFLSSRGKYRKFANKGLACEYMQHKNKIQDNFLVCFFIFRIDSSISLSHHFFIVTDDSIVKSTKYKYGYIDNLDDIKQIQVETNSNMKNVLVCLLYTNKNLECNKFNYPGGFLGESGEFYQNIRTNFNCRNELYGMKLNYLPDIRTVALSCINPVSTVQAIFFDDDLI